MKIQQIRNATIIIEYAGKRFLVDPMLGEKGSFAPFPLSNHQELRNPLHDLPVKAEVIVSNIDCVLLTHLHLDPIDDAAYKLLNKQVHIFVQDEQDRNTVMSHGFTHVEIIGEDSRFGDIHLAKSVPMPTISHFHEPRSRKQNMTAKTTSVMSTRILALGKGQPDTL